MKTTEEKIEYIRTELNKKFGKISFSVSDTDFGFSCYISNLGHGKIRISDHSVTNTYRLFNEIHYTFDMVIANIESFFTCVESVIYPERFEYITVIEDDIHYTHNIYKSIEHFNECACDTTIESVREFVNKRGESKVEIYYNYPVKKEKRILVRK